MGINISKRSFLKGLLASPLAAKASLWDNSRHKDEEQLAGDNKLRICFGSCNRQGRSQAYWSKVAATEPDAWFWLGDNIYGDTENPPVLAARYGSMLRGDYGNFRSQFRVEGIWDDHDYGLDGSNRAHPQKEKSQELFLDFLQADPSDERRSREGIYYCRTFGVGTKEVKVFFLDCRYFKDPEKGSGATLLGTAQWQWLEEEMASSRAQVNIIVSPIGFLLNRLFVTEDWAEYPRERSRLLDLIGKYDLQGTFFLSGDKHFGAAIKKRAPRSERGRVSYFEFQSSGLTHNNGEERLRIIRSFYGRRNIIGTKNFGQIDFEEKKGQLHMSWTLHSLDNDQLKLKREFQLKKNLWVLS